MIGGHRAAGRFARSRLKSVVLLATILAYGAPQGWQPAAAQMMLPGATNGASPGAATGTAQKPTGGGASEGTHAPPKPIILKPPSEDTIAGHVLARDGLKGAMSFDKSGDDLVLSKLALTGDKISAPTKDCSLDVSLTPPLAITPAGRPEGAIRYQVPLQACPFTIDVLNGAVLVSTPKPTCEFTAADCRVSLSGLWGPAPVEITDKRAKELERERVRIETTMRANFRVLLKRAGKDRDLIKAIAREQAGFSSSREMTCRDYAKESVFGFCSTQITEARVLALLAKFGEMPEPVDRRHAARERAKAHVTREPVAAPATSIAPDPQQ